jgi:hypothetical protein
LWDEPHPHARIPMMPNKISEAKRTNKGHLTCSIYCTWAWSSSHFNSTFFFTLSRAFFPFCFCLACGLLKIQAFITWWFCCLGPPTQEKDDQICLPTCEARVCCPNVDKVAI